MKKQSELMDAADKYMEVATKRFAKRVNRAAEGEDEFVNGFSWGANAGYIAGFKAASKKRPRSRRGVK